MATLAPYAKQHEPDVLNGPGDSRPTAQQIVEDQGLVGKLKGKVILVTGCTSGLGLETARAFHSTGADVYMQVRNLDRGLPVQKDILSDGRPGKVELIELDLGSFASIRKGAEDFLSKSKTLNLLVNNAGVMATPEGTTEDGFETQFGTNHLGHFLLFQLLKLTLLASITPDFNSRVISVSSTGHRNNTIHFDDFNLKKAGYTPFGAYGQSKLANIYFATELNRRYGSRGLHALSLMPGGILTPLQRHIPEMMEKARDDPTMLKFGKSIEQGAATTVWAALAKELEGVGGKYLENCQESYPDTGEGGMLRMGYAKYAFDEEAEKRLWRESCRMVGVEDDDA